MPRLNKRQYDLGVEAVFQKLAERGADIPTAVEALKNMDPSERLGVMEKAWLSTRQAPSSTLSSMSDAASMGFTAGTFTEGSAANLRAQQTRMDEQMPRVSPEGKMELPPERPFEEILAEQEDAMLEASLRNPKTYSLFQIAGMLNPFSAASKIQKGFDIAASKVLPQIAGEGLKRVAARRAMGGLSAGAQELTEQVSDPNREINLREIGSATAFGTGLGAASPYIGAGAKKTADVTASAVNTTLDAFKKTATTLSKMTGKWTPRAQEIADKIQDFIKFEKAGVPLEEAKRKITLGYARAGERLAAARGQVRERTAAAQEAIASMVDDAKAALGFDDFEFGQTAKDLRDFFNQGLDDFSREVSEKAQQGAKYTKEEFRKSFYALQNMLRGAEDAFGKEYGRQIKIYEDLGKDLQIDATEEFGNIAKIFEAQNLFVKVNGQLRDVNPAAQLGKGEKMALLRLLALAQKPGNFRQVNQAKQLVGKHMNRVADPEMRNAFHAAYNGLRSKLLNSFDSPAGRKALEGGQKLLGTGNPLDDTPGLGKDHLDRLFKEYWEGSQVASRLSNALEGTAPDTIGLTTLKNLAADAERVMWDETAGQVPRFTTIQPMSDEAAMLINKAINLKTREQALGKYVDVNSVHKKVQALTKALDPSKALADMEDVVGTLANRERVLQSLSSSDLPETLVKAAKTGGELWKTTLERLKKEAPGMVGSAQRLHDRYQKWLRLNGYKSVELFESMRQPGVDTQILDDVQDLASLKPEITKLFEEENLLDLMGLRQKAGKREALARVSELNPKRLQSELDITWQDIRRGGITSLAVGPKAMLKILGMVKIYRMLTNPASAAYIAEKYKLVPPAKIADWGREAAYHLTKIRPAVRDAVSSQPSEEQ